MNVLVTGGAGYIGSHTCKALAKAGITPITYDNLSTGHKWAVRWGPLVIGDLRDRSYLRSTMRSHAVEAVFHFAANNAVGESVQNPRKYYGNNLVNSIGLFDAMLDTGVRRIVFSSTCAIFGRPDRQPMDENLPTGPINPYGESKLAFERILRWYNEIHGLRFVSLRYFNAAGASARFGEDHRRETHLIPNVLKVALGQKASVEVYGTDYETPDGTCIRDYIHIVDLARAHILALDSAKSEFYNLGTGGGASVREVIDVARKVTGRSIETVERSRRPGDPPRLVATSEKIKRELGWNPQFQSLETIIESAWKWHQRFPRGYED